MKKNYTLFLMLFVFICATGISQNSTVQNAALGPNNPTFNNNNIESAGCFMEQTGNAFENGYASNTGTSATAAPFASADDIIIPANESRTINSVTFYQFSTVLPVMVDVMFFDDATGPSGVANGGSAQDLNASFTGVVVGNNFGFDVYEIVVTLSTPITLTAGASATTFWLCCLADDGAGGNTYWEVQTITPYNLDGWSSSTGIIGPWSENTGNHHVFQLHYGSDVTVTNSSPTLTANATGVTYQWIDCNAGNAYITGETGQSYTATVTGSYAVEVTTVVNGCTVVDTSACEAVTVIGINELTDAGVSIYPNPTSNLVTVDLGSYNGTVNYTVTTIEGRIVEQAQDVTTKTITLDLSDESNGIYLLKINAANSSNVYKIIKE